MEQIIVYHYTSIDKFGEIIKSNFLDFLDLKPQMTKENDMHI